jgi:hypothetical protein
MSKCEHGRQKSICKECGGCGLCQHGKQKRYCKECGGSAFCEHGKRKERCKECSGSSICEHDKRKEACKECHGSSFCEHGKLKQICKECSGVSLCEHNIQKNRCKECGGSSVCEHGKQKSQCKDCRGSQICQHNIRKTYCKECGGGAICKHDKSRSCCKECGGSSFCEHDKYKQSCKDCGGSKWCIHEKDKQYCKICDGKYLCKSKWCVTIGNRYKYNGYCISCFVHLFPDKPNTRNYKTKEKDVVDRITQTFNNFTWVSDKKVQDGCSRRRPDLLLDMGSHIIIMEVDENKHTDYDCSCEHKRLMELSQDLQHRPIIFIRFNPDDYTNQEGILVKSCWKLNKLGVMQITKTKQKEWEERIEALKQQIQYWIDNPTEKTIEIIELFY